MQGALFSRPPYHFPHQGRRHSHSLPVLFHCNIMEMNLAGNDPEGYITDNPLSRNPCRQVPRQRKMQFLPEHVFRPGRGKCRTFDGHYLFEVSFFHVTDHDLRRKYKALSQSLITPHPNPLPQGERELEHYPHKMRRRQKWSSSSIKVIARNRAQNMGTAPFRLTVCKAAATPRTGRKKYARLSALNMADGSKGKIRRRTVAPENRERKISEI